MPQVQQPWRRTYGQAHLCVPLHNVLLVEVTGQMAEVFVAVHQHLVFEDHGLHA